MPYIELINPYPISNRDTEYLNSVNVLVVPSLTEGSSNIVKEAMACNCPIVSTDMGDVRWVFGETKGFYIASFDEKTLLKKRLALKFSEISGKTNGEQKIKDLGLDSETIAYRVTEVYKTV